MRKLKLDSDAISETLNWVYGKSVNGLTGLASAKDLGNEYLNKDGLIEQKIRSLIRWQNSKCAVSGFLSGLGRTFPAFEAWNPT